MLSINNLRYDLLQLQRLYTVSLYYTYIHISRKIATFLDLDSLPYSQTLNLNNYVSPASIKRQGAQTLNLEREIGQSYLTQAKTNSTSTINHTITYSAHAIDYSRCLG